MPKKKKSRMKEDKEKQKAEQKIMLKNKNKSPKIKLKIDEANLERALSEAEDNSSSSCLQFLHQQQLLY